MCAAQIDYSNDRTNMAYVGATPWWGGGNRMAEGASIDEWAEAAGLTWEAKTGRIRHELDSGELAEVPAYRTVYRADTGKVLHVASDRYKPVQPKQVLEFFREIVAAGNLKMETAGSLRGGACIWALARNPHAIKVGRHDIIDAFVRFSTTFDGSMQTRWAFTGIRVVCQNTMNLSYRADKNYVGIRHTVEVDDRMLRDVAEQLGLLGEVAADFEIQANKLAQIKVSEDKQIEFLIDLVGKVKPGTDDQLTTHSVNVIEQIKRTIETGPGADLDTSAGTAWGVFNGVTRWIDYDKRAQSDDNRGHSAWFGEGSRLKDRAMRELLELA